jgi:hypothetical protein
MKRKLHGLASHVERCTDEECGLCKIWQVYPYPYP